MSYSNVYQPPAPTASGLYMPADYGGDHYAQNTRAWLAREEWADYQTRFQPTERELINSVMTPDLLNERLSSISVNNSNAFDAATKTREMMNRRYGISPSAQQQGVMATQDALAKTASGVDAANNTRQAVYDRNLSVLGGGGAVRADINSAYTQG